VVVIKAKQLLKIYKFVRARAKSEHLEWLKKKRLDYELPYRNMYELSFKIQSLLDAFSGREKLHKFSGGLPIDYLLEVAQLLNLIEELPEGARAQEVLKKILTRIEGG